MLSLYQERWFCVDYFYDEDWLINYFSLLSYFFSLILHMHYVTFMTLRLLVC